ncbi:unnamed protein product [Fusarium venenatum]|uniref:Fe2OG dioxygenase domain-containing protein n=2 Tax=Fusarium venenatum TaxID=56646 RepID=A0A2L2TPA3_9HYPO|nr:uncharacterized protein FVRRES_04143 [Fusarium venenatum]CEI67631.1 unnamed protein product [Fusarium venenatum]
MTSKMVAAHPPQASPHRGYSFVGQEKLAGVTGFAEDSEKNSEIQDNKETFDLGSPDDSEFPNRWPSECQIPQFRAIVEQHYEALEQVQLQVLAAFALGLGLKRNFFSCLHEKSHHEMRLLHYPSTKVGDLIGGKTRIADHTDFGSVTLLFQDNTGGLEGRDRETGRYQAIESQPMECLVIVGDCFQRWTGNQVWAIPHRVTVPYRTAVEDNDCHVPERFSIAFFGKPNRDAQVGNLNHPRFQAMQYSSITAGEYNNMKLERTY